MTTAQHSRPRRLLALGLFALLAAAVLAPARADFQDRPPKPLAEWLADVAFIGVGTVSDLSVDPATSYVSFSISNAEAWKGVAPRSARFERWPYSTPVSEGQRVVFVA